MARDREKERDHHHHHHREEVRERERERVKHKEKDDDRERTTSKDNNGSSRGKALATTKMPEKRASKDREIVEVENGGRDGRRNVEKGELKEPKRDKKRRLKIELSSEDGGDSSSQEDRSSSSSSGSSSGTYDSYDSESSSEEEQRRKRRKRRQLERQKERDREKQERERRRKKKEKMRKQEEKKKLKEERRRKKKDKTKGPVTDSWGKYGLIKEIDMWNKRPEFSAWLAEIKKVNLETLPAWEEKQMFKEYMEDFNTATLPKKYYDLDAYHRRKMMKERDKNLKSRVESERTEFNDEEQRRQEVRKAREQQKEAEIEALKRAMQSGMAQAMREQAQLREEMQYQYRLGNLEAAAAIQRRLDPDASNQAAK